MTPSKSRRRGPGLILPLVLGAAACATTGKDLKVLAEADAVYLYHWDRYERACTEKYVGTPTRADCKTFREALLTLNYDINLAGFVAHGGPPLPDGKPRVAAALPLTKEQVADLEAAIAAVKKVDP